VAPQIPAELSSAQATMTTFLQAFDPTYHRPGVDPLANAAACLDLGDLPKDIRLLKGPELADDLKEILDRTALIELTTISADPAGEPYRIRVHAPRNENSGLVVLGADADGFWRFDRATVASIPAMLEGVRERAIVAGVVREGPRTFSKWLRDQMPETLRSRAVLLEHWQWLALFLIALTGTILDRLVTAISRGKVTRTLQRWLTGKDAGWLNRSLRPLGLLAASAVWWLGVTSIALPPTVLAILVLAVRFVAATSLVWAAYNLVNVSAAVLERRAAETENKLDDLLVPLVRKSFKVLIIAFGLVFIADNLNLPITSLLTGVGIGGLALALAAKDTVSNVFGSFMVVLDQPFHVGDWVVIGGIEGTVAEVGFRSTRIRTFYDSIVTLPNANLINASVDNYGSRNYRRWSTRIRVPYQTDPDRLEAFCEGIRELIRRHPYTRKDFYIVNLNEFGLEGLEIMLYMFFDVPEWNTEVRERHRLALDILRLGRELGVEVALSSQTLYLQRPGERAVQAADGWEAHIDDALENARERDAALVDGAVGGKIPPPVKIVVPGGRGEAGHDAADGGAES
jgi:MscS family membrane protein